MVYQIKIKGNLDQSWFDWLGKVNITADLMENGSIITTFTLDVIDQPVLFGILDRIRDLNIPLVSVTTVEDQNAGGLV